MHTPYLVSIFICPIVPYYSNWTQDSLDILFEMYILRSHPKPTDNIPLEDTLHIKIWEVLSLPSPC
jgi:hypothetical protein